MTEESGRTVSFFQRVYDVVRRIPYGRVASYGQVAMILEHPQAARTVGWAMHALPADSDVPWHRVINSQGRVSTSCLTHPPDLQRRLLEEEGVVFGADGRVDMRRFGWNEWPLWEENR